MSTLVINGNGFKYQVRSKSDKLPKVTVLSHGGINSVKTKKVGSIKHAA